MAKQRYINTKFWSDNWVIELDPIERYLFLYFLTNEHTNIAGIYELPLRTMAFETGMDKEMLGKILPRFKGKVYYIDGWVYIKNFSKHQAVNDSVTKGIKAALETVPKEIMDKVNSLDTVSDTLSDPATYLNLNSNLNSNVDINILAKQVSQGQVINELIELFKDLNPMYSEFYKNKTERKALEVIVKQLGYDKTKSLISNLPAIVAKKFAPKITKPSELKRDMGKLILFFKQEGQPNNKNKIYGL